MNPSQKLGIKVFYYYLSKKTLVGILLLIVSVFVSSSKDFIVSKLGLMISSSSAVSIATYFISTLFIVSVLLIILGVLISWLSYISLQFTLGENAISITKGILSKREISIPYRQIQNIDIEQSFNHKMMGVSKLVILTAGNDNNDTEGEAEGVFHIIQSDIAGKIKEYILEKANPQVIKSV